MRTTLAYACLLLIPIVAQAQVQRSQLPANEEFGTNRPLNLPTADAEEYQIGKNDLIDVSVFEVPDLSSSARVSATGLVSLPLVGEVMAAGNTTQQLARLIEAALKKNYVKDPHVTVFVREYASQPVSVIGAVKGPGIYQIKGQKLLLEMLAMASGLDQAAGKTIQVIRKASETGEGAKTIIIDAHDLFVNGKTELNIPIQAGDTINVLQAGSIFVVGEVNRPGEYILRQGKDVTVAQAVALGSGFTRDAKKEGVIIRVHQNGVKEEIPVNVGKILDGSLNDVAMMSNDILFVPANKVKSGLMRTLDTTIAIVSGRLMYVR